jgi:hypothetical protein
MKEGEEEKEILFLILTPWHQKNNEVVVLMPCITQ